MTLADTSIWIDHLRRANPALIRLLDRGLILGHPFVLGELACGSLASRQNVLADLARLPRIVSARDGDVLAILEQRRLMGTGIGYLDAHLLASVLLTDHTRLWTRDRRLGHAAVQLSVEFDPG